MSGRITNDARDSVGRAVLQDSRRRGRFGRVHSHTWMIVVEDEDTFVIRVARATDPRIAGTQITITYIGWTRRMFVLELFAAPRAILAMGRHDYPLFAERMPTFFPGHVDSASSCAAAIRVRLCEPWVRIG